MAVYLFTLHAYRSWNADNPRGFVKHDQGIQAPNVSRAKFYDSQASQEPVRFSREHQEVIAWIVADACGRRNWRLHGLVFEDTHVHTLVSWREFQEWQAVRGKLKNLASLELGRYFDTPGWLWFASEGSRKRVRDRKHFEHLMNSYLPKHRGLVWREGDPLPQKPQRPWAAARG
jgi:REP element-mobilizing transposase RayT